MSTTEELADALLADEMRKSSVTSIQTQAQVHSPIGAFTLPTGPVTSTPLSGLSIGSGDSGIGETSSESSGVSIEKVQHQLAITTQELMETKEALENSEKTISELKGRGEAGGKIHVDLRFKMRPCLKRNNFWFIVSTYNKYAAKQYLIKEKKFYGTLEDDGR